MALHASTQCSIRTVDRAKELEASGFSRIVLEREISLRQIKEIASSVGCEIEFFVHGALCVCYSGQCYLSEKIAGRSANRGACIQACRSRYDLVDSDGRVLVRDKALLSLKDYNLISRLEELADAGVMSFKIEGRLKNISYVRNTVRAYSIALDRIVEKSGGKYCRASFGKVSGGFTPDLDKTFNRGYTELYIDGRRGKWASMDTAKSMGEELGTVTRLNRERTSFTIRPYGDRKVTVHNGDGLSFIEKDGSIEGVRADIGEGASVHCKSTPALFEGARIFRNYDIAFERELESKTCIRRLAAEITVSFGKASGTGTLTVTAAIEDGREARRTYTGIWNDMAANIGRMESMIRTQLSKSSGIYSFTVKDIVYGGSLPLLSSSALNSIRNDLAALLDSLAPDCSAERGGRYFTPPDGSVQYDRSVILSDRLQGKHIKPSCRKTVYGSRLQSDRTGLRTDTQDGSRTDAHQILHPLRTRPLPEIPEQPRPGRWQNSRGGYRKEERHGCRPPVSSQQRTEIHCHFRLPFLRNGHQMTFP
jgi:putative protease